MITKILKIFLEAVEEFRRENASKGMRLSAETLNSWLELKFGRLQPDHFLSDYVDLLKCKLVAAESSET